VVAEWLQPEEPEEHRQGEKLERAHPGLVSVERGERGRHCGFARAGHPGQGRPVVAVETEPPEIRRGRDEDDQDKGSESWYRAPTRCPTSARGGSHDGCPWAATGRTPCHSGRRQLSAPSGGRESDGHGGALAPERHGGDSATAWSRTKSTAHEREGPSVDLCLIPTFYPSRAESPVIPRWSVCTGQLRRANPEP
jgi:hypothetical protein